MASGESGVGRGAWDTALGPPLSSRPEPERAVCGWSEDVLEYGCGVAGSPQVCQAISGHEVNPMGGSTPPGSQGVWSGYPLSVTAATAPVFLTATAEGLYDFWNAPQIWHLAFPFVVGGGFW